MAGQSALNPAHASLPNSIPRPAGELELLRQLWRPPSGLRFLTVINNTYVGVLYLGAAFLFFLMAGVLALLMRMQLAMPDNAFLSSGTYNQLFTMHGTVMMFLFAVPAVEAIGVLLLPNMVGARDLPFPRLSAFAFWTYFIGGLVFFSSILFDAAPRGGWFMYPPLTNATYSPGVNEDLWLLGIGFIEISAIAGAIEIIVGVLRTRAPGMTLDRLPVFAWAMLVFAGMIVFAFPAVIVATALLELERAFGWPFFDATRHGDPLLWQHLFWFFGHPEVYIIFLPAVGMVSMIVPAMTGTRLVAHRPVVLALVGTGLLSFGLWVHHMFATGIPRLAASFFSAASMAVALPAGVQVFAWIATFAAGRMQIRTPALFVLGFLFTFVLGGLTGVMVAVVPFDWQVHDTYFVVAHLHYVLFGGMVLPLFAALYYWMPFTSTRTLSERLGRWVFALIFVGFNVAFLPMHLTGLLGMPRRVYTYGAEMGWGALNMVSTTGAFLVAAGVALFLVDLARNFRMSAEGNAGNVWKAGTLEWLPTGNYSTRSIPIVGSREPLWDQPGLARDVESGGYYLPGSATGGRETIVSTARDAIPQYLLLMPFPSWAPVLAACFTAGFFLLLTVKAVAPALACGVLAGVCMVRWLWDTDPGTTHEPVDIGHGIKLPVSASGSRSHSWWATAVLVAVGFSLLASASFAYLFLWTASPEAWPPITELPSSAYPLAAGAALVLSSAGFAIASRGLHRNAIQVMRFALTAALALGPTAIGIEMLGQWRTGVRPTANSYGAVLYAIDGLEALSVALVALMTVYTLARSSVGLIRADRRATFDNTALMWHYTVAQGLVVLALVHGFPRLVA